MTLTKKLTAALCSTLILASTGIACFSASAETETVEFGASWYHNAGFSWGQKKCTSNLTSQHHPHNSTACVGDNVDSDEVVGGTSYASVKGAIWKEANAYYDIW